MRSGVVACRVASFHSVKLAMPPKAGISLLLLTLVSSSDTRAAAMAATDSLAWTQVVADSMSNGYARGGVAMVFDSRRDRVIALCGANLKLCYIYPDQHYYEDIRVLDPGQPTGWDILPVAGQVIFFSPSGTLGRTDRRMDIPEDARRLTLLHEGSHFAWKLSWRGNDLPPGLDDEYNYDPPDSACIMDLQFAPIRWCSGGSLPSPDHVTKSGGQEATSCWEQILKDYPAYHFGGSSNASSPLPALSVEYNDEP